MNRSKLVAVITGAISIILAIAYLVIVQLLDFRGEMLPAPQSQLPQLPVAVTYLVPAQELSFDALSLYKSQSAGF